MATLLTCVHVNHEKEFGKYETAAKQALNEVQAYAVKSGRANIGKTVSVSKVRYWWTLCFAGGLHKHIELIVSVRSGKRVVLLDGVELRSENVKSMFQMNLTTAIAGDHLLQIKGRENKFEVLIDSIPFDKLPKNHLGCHGRTCVLENNDACCANSKDVAPQNLDLLTGKPAATIPIAPQLLAA